MLKQVLMTTAALAILAMPTQIVSTPAQAQANFKPKIKVAPPKARIRVVKPRVRIRLNTNQFEKKKKKKDEENSTAVATGARTVTKVTPRVVSLAPEKPQPTSDFEKLPVTENQASELGQIKGLMDAMKASKELLELASIGRSFSPLDPFSDALNRDEEEDNGEFAPPGNGLGKAGLFGPHGMFGDELSGAGVGSDLFNTVGPNSHTRDVPGAAPIKVTPGSIAAAIGGVAGNQTVTRDGPVTKTVNTAENTVTISKTTPTDDDPDGGVRHTFVEYGDDGQVTSRGAGHTPRNTSQTVWFTHYSNGAVTRFTTPSLDRMVGQTDHQTLRNGTMTEAQRDLTGGVNELRDPDSAGASWVPPWCTGDARCGRNTPLTTATVAGLMEKVNKTLPPAPDGTQPPGHNGGTPVVSKDDLVSTYDPDSRNDGSGPTPIPTCMHSEC